MSNRIIGDDGDHELLCKHGVGHSSHVHTCDGCCRTTEFSIELRRFEEQLQAPARKERHKKENE